MQFKLMGDSTFIVTFTPEEAELAIAFLKTLQAPNPEQEFRIEELIMLLGGVVEPDRTLLLQ